MKRIGKPVSFISLLILLLGFSFQKEALAQSSVNLSASVSENKVFSGERVTLSIEISGDFNNVSRPEIPGDIPGFRMLSNTPSTSRSFSFVNGESSTTYTYTYYLIAQQEGSHQIPEFSVNIDDTEYTTRPLSVEVIDRNSSADSPSSQQPDIFLQLDVSDETPVTGQQLIVDVVLFFKSGLEVNSYQPVPGWKAEGFWKEELENSRRPQATSVIVDGVRYRKARLLQFALFPTKSGELTISPYEIAVSVRSSNSRRDSFSSFFGGFGTNQRQVELESDPITLNVEELPALSEGDFLGAVGEFEVGREISTTKTMVGESIEVTTTISGTGNIPLISKPDYELPEGLEVYDPQEKSNLNRRNQQISGTKVYTDIIIARSPGTYTIPGKTVSYFNPSTSRHVTRTLPPLSFSAEPNPETIAANDSRGSFSVRPVTGLANWVRSEPADLASHWWFWAGIIMPLLLLGVAYWRKTYLEKLNTDITFARSEKARDKASERLNEAVRLSETGEIKPAYNMLQKALTGFISDKMGLAEAGLSNEEYIRALQEQKIDPNLVKNVRLLLDKCASISYAPNPSREYLKSHVGLAESTIDKLKKVL